MKWTSGVISVLAAAMFFSAAPARGGLHDSDFLYDSELQPPTMQQVQKDQKDECLLVRINCRDSYKTATVDQRIDRLKKEIAKGTDVYTEQELNTLKKQLNLISGEKGGDKS
jgi:hypothetical protein